MNSAHSTGSNDAKRVPFGSNNRGSFRSNRSAGSAGSSGETPLPPGESWLRAYLWIFIFIFIFHFYAVDHSFFFFSRRSQFFLLVVSCCRVFLLSLP